MVRTEAEYTKHQAEKMSVITNLQMMQEKVSGESGNFDFLNRWHIDHLRKMQDELIPKYNAKIAEGK